MSATVREGEVVEIGSDRELFVDGYLIDRLEEGVRLKLHHPRPAGVAIRYDEAWENDIGFYTTILKDGDTYRMYYRGASWGGPPATCYAGSPDGIHWTKPNLGLVEIQGSTANGVILESGRQFTPFIDTRPGVPAAERYKANGLEGDTLIAYVSADGIRWRKLREEPILRAELINNFDSQNVIFWSQVEGCYVLYARHSEGGRRSTSRATSRDFVNWSPQTLMTYSDTGSAIPSEHLYTNQTHPFFRAPQIYISLPGRIYFGRRMALRRDQVEFFQRSVGRTGGAGDVSDGVFMTTRPGTTRYDFTFRESFIRAGIGLGRWTSRTNYPAQGVVPTGPNEMSLYVQRDYGQGTAHLERMTLRTDGFASAHASYEGGEMVTKPLTFEGTELEINYSTSAAGSVQVEIQDADGGPLPGYSLEECPNIIGDEIAHVVVWGDPPPPLSSGTDAKTLEQESGLSLEAHVTVWEGRKDVGKLAGRPIRLRFVLKDADLYSFRFA